MSKFFSMFKKSFSEVKNIKAIVICGFLLALSVVLGRYSIRIGTYIIIGFSFIANSIAGMLFGPVFSGILGGTSDVLNFMISAKGSFFFGFTLNSILAGVIYGIFLYRKTYDNYNKKSLLIRIFCAKFITSVFVNLLLGTLWVSIINGKGFMVYLPARFIKEVVSVPVHTFVLYVILSTINKSKIASDWYILFKGGVLIFNSEVKIAVRYQETDQMGIAHHSVYPIWYEEARTDFIRKLGISYSEIEKMGIMLPLVSLNSKYIKPAFYEDILTVFVNIAYFSSVKIEFNYKIYKDNSLINIGNTEHPFINKDFKLINIKKFNPEIFNILNSAYKN